MQGTTSRVSQERSQDPQDMPYSSHPLNEESEEDSKEENNGSSFKDNDDYENLQELPQGKEHEPQLKAKIS